MDLTNNVKELYLYSKDHTGGVTMWINAAPKSGCVYIDGEEANAFIKEVEDAKETWRNKGETMFETLEKNISYIISQYFLKKRQPQTNK